MWPTTDFIYKYLIHIYLLSFAALLIHSYCEFVIYQISWSFILLLWSFPEIMPCGFYYFPHSLFHCITFPINLCGKYRYILLHNLKFYMNKNKIYLVSSDAHYLFFVIAIWLMSKFFLSLTSHTCLEWCLLIYLVCDFLPIYLLHRVLCYIWSMSNNLISLMSHTS